MSKDMGAQKHNKSHFNSHWLYCCSLALLLAACATGPSRQTNEKREPGEDTRLEDSGYRVDYWEMNKENCEDVLRDPYAFDLPRVFQCVQLWESYREVTALSTDVRSMYAVGFSRVFHESKGYSQIVAKAALNRVCVPLHPLGLNGKVEEKVPQILDCGDGSPFVNRGQQPVSPEQKVKSEIQNKISPEVEAAVKLSKRRALLDVKSPKSLGKATANRAQLAYGKCNQAYSGGYFAHAINFCNDALKIYPNYVAAKYTLAQIYAALGENEVALTHLTELYMWNSAEVTDTLRKARHDGSVKNLRDDLRFKVMTGYRRTTALNGAGEAALPDFEKVVLELFAKEYDLEGRIGNDKNIRLYPIIYYRPLFKLEAQQLRVILSNEQTRLAPITWETRDDFIIVWGSDAGAALFAADSQAAPIPQGTPAKTLEEISEDPLGDALGKAEELKGKAEETKAAGEGLAEPPPAE